MLELESWDSKKSMLGEYEESDKLQNQCLNTEGKSMQKDPERWRYW